MILLEMGLLNETQVFAIFLTILLGICSFFLTQFYFMVKQIADDVKNLLIKDAGDEERIERLEEDILEIKSDIKKLYRENDD